MASAAPNGNMDALHFLTVLSWPPVHERSQEHCATKYIRPGAAFVHVWKSRRRASIIPETQERWDLKYARTHKLSSVFRFAG
jgi:hypothetical protein